MSVIGKWSKVFVFVLEPAFYYLCWRDGGGCSSLSMRTDNDCTSCKILSSA